MSFPESFFKDLVAGICFYPEERDQCLEQLRLVIGDSVEWIYTSVLAEEGIFNSEKAVECRRFVWEAIEDDLISWLDEALFSEDGGSRPFTEWAMETADQAARLWVKHSEKD